MMRPDQQPNAPLWIGVILSFYAFIAIGIAESGLGVLLPSILVAYELNPASITELFLSQISGYIIAAFSSSLISSRLGLARMLLLAAIALTMALTLYALSPYWILMVAAGSFLGLGIGLIDAGINTYILQAPGSANLIGLLHAFYGVGAFSGPTLATTLLAWGLDWRQIYLVIMGIVSLLILGILGVIIGQYHPMTTRVDPAQAASLSQLQRSLKTPVVLLTGLLLLVYVGIEASIGNWAYTVQTVARQTPGLIAGYSVSAYWLGLTIGRFSLGYFLQRLGAVRTISLSLSMLLISLVAWWQLSDPWFSLPLMGLALAPIFPATMWLIPHRLPEALVPAGVSFAASAASFGAAICPTGLGWIADRAGLGIIPVLMLPLALLMVGLHRWLILLSRKK